MSMLPIFLVGLLLGILLAYAWYNLKKDTPSEVKIKLQQDEIKKYKEDIVLLEKNNSELYNRIDTLREELEKNSKKKLNK